MTASDLKNKLNNIEQTFDKLRTKKNSIETSVEEMTKLVEQVKEFRAKNQIEAFEFNEYKAYLNQTQQEVSNLNSNINQLKLNNEMIIIQSERSVLVI